MPRGVNARKSAQNAVIGAQVHSVAPKPLARHSFYRNKRVSVDGISGDDLKAYARSIGISQRDVDGLTEDRLRQNCKSRILDSMED